MLKFTTYNNNHNMENANQNKGYNRLKAVLADKGETNRWLAGQMGKSENTISR